MSEVLTREIDELRLLMGSPRDPHGRVFAQLGDALRRAGSHREALNVLLDGVSEHPNFAPGHLVLGWTAQESGDLEVARTAYERTVELDPENPNGLFGLGTLLERDGKPEGMSLIEEAESLDERVRDSAPGFPGPRAVEDDDSSVSVLPFVPLAELAPDGGVEDATALDAEVGLDDLPFMSLEELAPGEGADASASLDAGVGLDDLPFLSLEELAPQAPEDAAPDSLEELAPDDQEELSAEAADESGSEATVTADADPMEDLDALPFAALDDLRPDEAPEGHAPEALEIGVAPGMSDTDVEVEIAIEPEGSAEAAVESEAPAEVEAPDASEALHEDGDGHDEEPDVLADPLVTRTMGELLVRQGLTAEAVEVFRTLVARSPDDGSLQERLAELTGELSPASGEASAASHEPDEVAAHPSMDPPVPHPEVPSPFHLAQGEVDEAAEEEGEVVGDYFARLLAWSPERDDDPGDPARSEGEEPSSS